MDDRVVEVIQICFVLGLKLMEKVEQAEGKRRMRLNQSGREPPHLEELLMAVGRIPRGTLAVPNDNLVDTSEVENSKLIVLRGVWAYHAKRVTTQLHYKAERTKKVRTEVFTVPSLYG